MSRPRDRAALQREERRLGELRFLPARAQAARMRRVGPALLSAAAGFVPLAGAALFATASPLAASWRVAAQARIVVVPDPASPATAGASGSRLDAVRALLGSAATLEDASQTQRLLAPWLGTGLDDTTLPGLLALDATPDAPDLAARLSAAAPGTTIAAAPAETAQRLGRLATWLGLACRLLLGAGVVLGAAVAWRAGRLAFDPSRASVRRLALLGAHPATLVRRAAWRAGASIAAGAALGAGAALPLLALVQGGRPLPASIACVMAAPLLGGALGGLRAGLAARAACEGAGP